MSPYLASSRLVWVLAAVLAVLSARPGAAADGRLSLTVLDESTGKPVACRMHLLGPGNRPRKVESTPFWSDHFAFPGTLDLKLPLGRYTFEIERGPEYKNIVGDFRIEHFADDSKQVALSRAVDMAAEHWWSGDLFIHRPPRDMELLMAAEDLHVAQDCTWWNDKNDAATKTLVLPKSRLVTFDHNRAYEVLAGGYSRAGTDLLCFHLPEPLLLPEDAAAEYPSLVEHLRPARQKEDSPLWIDLATSYGRDLPLLVAHGMVDSIEVANSHFSRKTMQADPPGGKTRDRSLYPGAFGFARWSQNVYFKLLDCGLRIPPSAGSGSGVAPNPVGYNRVYVHLDGEFDYQEWWRHLRAGQVVVTNGPLMRPTVEGQLPGFVFQGDEGKPLDLEIAMTLSTCEPISYLDIVQDGRVRQTIRFEDYVASGRLPKLHFDHSGWFLLRAVCDVSDTYRFAMTGPFYVEFGKKPRISRSAAQFFLDWVYDRARQIEIDDPGQRREVLDLHRTARDFWKDIVSRANAE